MMELPLPGEGWALHKMAIDSVNRRRGVGSVPQLTVDPVPDGIVGVFDRPHAAWIYPGFNYLSFETTDDLPLLLGPAMFADFFRYRGSENQPGSSSIPSDWVVNSGSFTTSEERDLVVSQAGELEYQGTVLSDLVRSISDDANYAIRLYFFGMEDLTVEIRSRRSDDYHIAFGVDLGNNLVYIDGKSPTQTVRLAEVEHNFTLNESYEMDLWAFGNTIFGILNRSILIETRWTNEITNYGFSINVPSIPATTKWRGNTVHLKHFAAYDLMAAPVADDTPDPDLDLPTLFRRMIKEELENPTVKDWNSFKKARMHSNKHRDFLAHPLSFA